MRQKSTYSQKLKDPRWQKRRLQILNDNDFICQNCVTEGKTVNVHHRLYRWDADPWEYEDDCFIVLCDDCHAVETAKKKEAFSALSETIQKSFLANGIIDLEIALNNIEGRIGYNNELIAGAIRWWLCDDKRAEYLMQTYFEHRQKS